MVRVKLGCEQSWIGWQIGDELREPIGGIISGDAERDAADAEAQADAALERYGQRNVALNDALSKLKDDDCDCNPFAIKFSQDSVSWAFKDKRLGTIGRLRRKLQSGWNPRTDPTFDSIAVTRRGGKWVTLDNRRLVAAQMAGKPIPCRLATDDEVSQAKDKFTSTNGGTSIDIRGVGTWKP